MQNSQWCPLLDHELLVNVEFLQDVHGDVIVDGAQCPVNFLFVLFARLDVMEIVSEGCLIDGGL